MSLEPSIDKETQKVSFVIKITLADVFGTHKYGAEMSARDLGWTIKDVYNMFNHPKARLSFYTSTIHYDDDGTRLGLYFSTTYASARFTHEESKRILEALLRHNGKYDLEIQVIDEARTHSFPAIKGTGKPIDPENIQKYLKLYFSRNKI